MSTPLVSIIIPLYGPLCYVRAGLLALSASLVGWPAPDPPVEILLVDNSGQAATAALAAAVGGPSRVLTLDGPTSFATANNRGAAGARGQWLLLLNYDTIPLPGWLEALLNAAAATGAGIASSQLCYPDDTIQHAGVGFDADGQPISLYHLQPSNTPGANVPTAVRAVTGAALLIDRALYQRLGGLDEGYRNSYEDLDLCCRARAAGATVQYVPDSRLYHFSSVSAGRFASDAHNRARFTATWRAQLLAERGAWEGVEEPGMAAEAAVQEALTTVDPLAVDRLLIQARSRLGERLWWQLRHLTWRYRGFQQQVAMLARLEAEQATLNDRLASREAVLTSREAELADARGAFAEQQRWSEGLVRAIGDRDNWIGQLEARVRVAEGRGLRARWRRGEGG